MSRPVNGSVLPFGSPAPLEEWVDVEDVVALTVVPLEAVVVLGVVEPEVFDPLPEPPPLE